MHNGATIRRVNRFTIPTTGYLFCLALSCLTTIFSISVNVFCVNHFLKTFLTVLLSHVKHLIHYMSIVDVFKVYQTFYLL